MGGARGRPSEPSTLGRVGVSTAAREIGVSPSALRLWERQGLVTPIRTEGGTRRYGPSDLARLRRVHRLRKVEGLNAAAIRRWLDASPDGEDPAARRDHHERRSWRTTASLTDVPTPPVSASTAMDRTTGERLRALRRARGLTLRQAADRSRLSISFISAVERGLSGASVTALRRLVDAYGATLGELLEARDGRRVTSADRRVLDAGRGVRIEHLAHGSSSLEPQLFVLQPGASSEGTYAHAGEEFMFVLSGAIAVWLDDDEAYRLEPGDALTYPSTIPHRFEAIGPTETRVIWVNTPPTF